MKIKLISNIGNTGEMFTVFQGQVQNIPYWLIDEKIRFNECISVEDNVLVFYIGYTPRIDEEKNNYTNYNWLGSLDEKDTLIHLAGLLHHYNINFKMEKDFNGEEWSAVLDRIDAYINQQLGQLLVDRKISKWFKEIISPYNPKKGGK